MEKIDKLKLVLKNCEQALDYYTNVFAVTSGGAMRMRREAHEVEGLVKYREYLIEQIEVLTPKPKRGNPNFGKNNPYQEKIKEAKQGGKE